MKIYTLTTQYANNMGALLQCYALSKYLNCMEHVECEVLQYLPKGYNRSWTTFHKPRTFRDVLKLMYEAVRIDLQLIRRRKQKKMRDFISKYIPLSSKKYFRNDILTEPPHADAFIVGSDQIWNFKLRIDPTYFLDFVSKGAKKISYAASIADDWKDEDAKLISPILNLFDNVSIRERGNLGCLNKVYKKGGIVVCDPVFLLEKHQWDEIQTKPEIEGSYIFCYFLSVSSMAVEAVNRIREITGLKVVHLNLNTLDKFHSDIEIKDADPSEFIGLIANAEYVCTNSFHCSAFSIIYHRNLTFVPKHMANERMVQLEDIFGIDVILTPEKLKSLTLSDLGTDYQSNKGGEFIEYSKRFLKDALNG